MINSSYRPEPPQLLPTNVADGRAPGVYYRIDGELVPVLHIWLDGSVPVFLTVSCNSFWLPEVTSSLNLPVGVVSEIL